MTLEFSQDSLKNLYLPSRSSHKGQNGKLTIVGGSHLFHGASLWALKVASRIVDMVFYVSTEENNQIAQKLKSELYDFIVIPKDAVDSYIDESDAVLIGPGLPREEGRESHEESTRSVTQRLLRTHPDKKWIIDAGSLQTMDKEWLLQLQGRVVVTPHPKEFETLFGKEANEQTIKEFAKMYNSVVLLKGKEDFVCSSANFRKIPGGNEGMTKGGTGDVLAGLVAALACKNELFLAACAGSFINKKAGDSLYKRVGPYFNASDLADEIPKAMKDLLL